MPKTRVVRDTNVWISGLLWAGPPHGILRIAEEGRIIVVTSPAIIEEIAEALARPKFGQRLAALRTSERELLESLLTVVEVYPSPRVVPVVTPDPGDDVILACARVTRAQWLVSGDRHLLAVRQYRGIRIVSPRAFLAEWRDPRGR